ncbi:MAG: hypothetical protein KGJ12_01985 [Gammaproteobacteria bacterium]|nr:hypothetical protein [Gammaproteobacteria bacterium]
MTITEGDLYMGRDGRRYQVVSVTGAMVTLEALERVTVVVDRKDLEQDVQNGLLLACTQWKSRAEDRGASKDAAA